MAVDAVLMLRVSPACGNTEYSIVITSAVCSTLKMIQLTIPTRTRTLSSNQLVVILSVMGLVN